MYNTRWELMKYPIYIYKIGNISKHRRKKMRQSKKEILTLALGIALLPPLWAIFAPYIGVTTGAVALICAGLYVQTGTR